MFHLIMTPDMAADHREGDSLAALISAKGRDNMNPDFIAGTQSLEEGY